MDIVPSLKPGHILYIHSFKVRDITVCQFDWNLKPRPVQSIFVPCADESRYYLPGRIGFILYKIETIQADVEYVYRYIHT